MKPPKLDSLADYLVSAYTTAEIRKLTRMIAPDAAASVPEGNTQDAAERVAQIVEHRGIHAKLHEQLHLDRPCRADDLAILFGRATRSRSDDITGAVAEALRCAEGSGEPRDIDSYLDGAGTDGEDLLYETFRSMAFGKSRAAWPYMARMTADYLKNRGGKPDTFFKRAAWLLERCEEEDLAIFVDALRSSLSLTATLRVEGGTDRVGVLWDYSDSTGIYLQTNPEPLIHAHLLVGSWERYRQSELVALIGQARLGVHRDGSVLFPLRAGVLDRLIALFCPGEQARSPKTTLMSRLEVPIY